MKTTLTIVGTIFFAFFFFINVPTQVMAAYPADLISDIPWSHPYYYPQGTSYATEVEEIQTWFNTARSGENVQLGTSLPMLTMPTQTEWDQKSDNEKALWLINMERVDRGVPPLHSVEPNVTSVAQAYAEYLMGNNLFGHEVDGKDPKERLNENSQINDCQDFLNVSENLSALFGSWNLPIERSIFMWMYDDAGSGWGHRQAILWYPYNDNSGTSGMEGFLGIGSSIGSYTYQGSTYSGSTIIVMNVFDSCPAWDYSGLTPWEEPVVESKGNVNGDHVVDLKDVVHALKIINNISVLPGSIDLNGDVNDDDKIGMEEVVFILNRLGNK